ncbi:hypothetical protein XH86_06865 [Bradyrhizobium guangdongense]|uniref:Uncharacterized protein n=1 Tax=Bradyrhizobium guangdongense TaxID=1325090 RepID=A0ABX6UC29_9BRAD|nr:hypothetical protein X265_06865 [Bradyrhizobium guangdongense]QOZ58488.1 hypothetical protein XH86_06865 [Bradyrhizobium guangdongense]
MPRRSPAPICRSTAAGPRSNDTVCHAPPRRGIQYAAARRLNYNFLGILDRPVKPGDDSERGRGSRPNDSMPAPSRSRIADSIPRT